jgi:hypothetical protein
VLGSQDAHLEEVLPAVGVELGLPADALVPEAACLVAPDGPVVSRQDLQFDPVRTERAEGPVKHQPGDLPAQPAAAQGGDEQAHAVLSAVLAGVNRQPRAADAVPVIHG